MSEHRRWPLLNASRRFGLHDHVISVRINSNPAEDIIAEFGDTSPERFRDAIHSTPPALVPIHFGDWPRIDEPAPRPSMTGDERLPWKSVWCEFAFPRLSGSQESGAFLLWNADGWTIEEKPTPAYVGTFFFQSPPPTAHMVFILFPAADVVAVIPRWEAQVFSSCCDSDPPKEQSFKLWRGGDDWQGASIAQAITFLKLFSCKNVHFREIHPSTRKPKRMKDPTRVIYRELEIVGSERVIPGRTGERRVEPRGTALHIVRGHFKEYTEKGLFGRPGGTGRWWWSPHVAGSQDFGTVLKSYAIKPPEGTDEH